MASASSLADALITTLQTQSASAFSTSNLSKNDFGLLDTSPCNAVYVILPAAFERTFHSFGNPVGEEGIYRFTLRNFLRDTGDPVSTINRVWQAEIDVDAALAADSGDLSGSALSAVLERGTGWDGNTFVDAGGLVWIPQDFVIKVQIAQ